MATSDGIPSVSPDGVSTVALPDDATRCRAKPAGIAPGQVLAGRFRIKHLIARGGMGEVYEAEDLELHEEVALKTILSEIANDPLALDRFKTEVHLARKVTHRSVCRIFDVFHHKDEGGVHDVTFLTMELLRGQTLAAHLSQAGRLSPDKALPVVEQVAGALEAAHQAAVIHRDLKASNVMLVPAFPGSKELRVVVTDFGLARRDPTVEGASIGVSTAGLAVGTPAYMAPEQIEGGQITPATDIYALGVMMYEMLTGRRPFEGDTPIALIMKRLEAPPKSPRVHVADLDPVWESAILRCLEREPSKRFATTGALIKVLRGEVPPPPVSRPRFRIRKQLWLVLALGLLVVGVMAGLVGWWVVGRVSSPTGETAAGAVPGGMTSKVARRSVAVLGLKNLTGQRESAWLAVALAEMLTSEMGAGEAIRTISGESVARLRAELPVAEFDSLAPDTLDRVRARLGSDLLVLGSYTVFGGSIRLDVRLQDTKTGDVISLEAQQGTENALFDLVLRTGVRLREKLGVSSPTSAEREAVRASLPQDPEAAKLYAEGLAKLRLFDTLGGHDLLEQAKAKDPNHALTHAALAQAWTLLGYDKRAEDESKKAMELASSMSREDRLAIEGQYREAAHQYDKAIEIFGSLFTYFPDNLEYGLRLATAQASGGKGKEALDTLASLRKLPAPAGIDPRIDVTEATCARYQRQSQRGVDAARAAAKAALALGAKHVLARARFEEGSGLDNLGQGDAATAALMESERLFREVGDRRGVAASINNRGLVMAKRGDLDGTEKLWGEALAIYRSIGNKSGEALLTGNLGNIEYARGNPRGAMRRWEETLPIFRELNEPDGEARLLNNIASVLGEQGDIAGARAIFEQALAIYRRIGHKGGILSAAGNIARSWHEEGDLAASERAYKEVMVLWKETGDKGAAAPFVEKYGDLLLDKGDVPGARARYAEAVGLWKEMKQDGDAVGAQLALLGLDLDAGKVKETEASARQVLERALRAKSPAGEANAGILLARIAAAQGRTADAKREVQHARALALNGKDRSVRLRQEIACARVLGGVGAAERLLAIDGLRDAEAEAVKIGMVPLAFEARLALGQLELRTSPAAAKARLGALEKEAETKGFRLIAQRAAAAAK